MDCPQDSSFFIMNVLLKKGSKGALVKQLQKALNLASDGIFGSLTEERVKEFQFSNGLKSDGVVGPATWAILFPNILKKSTRRINEIIVHCSATPEGKNFTVEDITRWHKERGWSTIGYHYVVYLDGSVHRGRDVNVAGAHCSGHNSYSIGVCYIGGCDKTGKKAKDTRTDAQKYGLRGLLENLKELYPKARIVSHHDYEPGKACPSFDATKEYASL